MRTLGNVHCSTLRFSRTDASYSKSCVRSAEESAEVRVSAHTRAFQALLYFFIAVLFINVCV
jgi:hypothetical protein